MKKILIACFFISMLMITSFVSATSTNQNLVVKEKPQSKQIPTSAEPVSIYIIIIEISDEELDDEELEEE